MSSALYKDAPYYGISTMRASHQIWFPHSTVNEAAGQHTNTIKYIYEDGTTAAPTVTQEVNMVRDLTLSLSAETIADIQTYAATHTADEILDYIKEKYEVTADTGWKVNNAVNTTTAYDAVTTPTIEGYTASIQSTNANGVSTSDASSVHAILSIPETIVENGQLTDAYKNNGTTGIPENYVTVVVYKKTQTQQTATITYVDSTTGNTLTVDTVTGDSNATIDYSTADKIKALEDQGYVLVTDGFPSGAVFDDDTSVDQSYTVTLKHDTATSTPDKPATPGEPINPNDPDGPKWPTEAGEVSKDVTLTVTYSDAGEKTPANNVQTATWNRTVTVDKVTGEVVSSTDWTPDKTTYNAVTTPVVEGYYADTAEVTAQTVTQEDITIPVVYKPLGMIIPVDPSGNPIPGTKTPQYNNDPDDPTKGGATPVPDVPGYTPQVPSVTPEKPGEDTPVIYVPVTPGTQQATITYIDQTTGEPITIDRAQGASNTPINYTTADKIKELTDKGYILVSDEFPSDATFDDDDQVDQNFNVTLKHDTATSTPDKPATPGEPINPNDPDGPKWPTEAGEVSKDVTLTVTYSGAGDQTPANNVQTATWNRTVTVDKVTGEVVSTTDWTANKTTYDAVTTPVITGYYADTAEVTAQTVTQENITIPVVYKPLGKIIPVDEDGNPLPDALTPQYNNDPSDPTKGGETPTPTIPGYHTETSTVDPDDPGSDTKVVYVKDDVDKYTLTENFVDDKGNKLADSVVKGDYTKGTDYDVTSDTKVIPGYYLTAVPTNATGTFGTENVTVDFVYAELGKIIPVDENGDPLPSAPTPQYNNDPSDPTKGGATPVPDVPGYTPQVPSVTPEKPGEDTPVIYVPVTPGTQQATITYIDQTTGEPITIDRTQGASNTPINYTTADKIKELTDKGYILVSDEFPSDATFDDDDQVDQNFNVTLKHDTATSTPDKPATPGEPINPNDPNGPKWPTEAGEVTKDVTLTVHYVGAGENTPADNVQQATWQREVMVDKVTGEVVSSTDWTPSQTAYSAVTTPIITGYYADISVVPSQTVTQNNIEVTVTYKPLGHIIPVDPAGDPLPEAPTPSYENDPNDPTKGGTTPVPDIPGYHPATPSVTPDKPGEDTPVVYVKDEPQKATITYIDQNTGDPITIDTVTGDPNTPINYTTADKIKELTDKGYVLVTDEFPSNATFDGDNNVDQNFNVTLKHDTTTSTPDKPATPGEPINPNDPNGPKWPSEAGEVTKDVTLTVHYVGAGENTPADNVQQATWQREVTVDKVTGEVLSATDWTPNKTSYDSVTTPVITGYYADIAVVPNQAVSQDNIELTVTYKPLGHIIPVDPAGDPLPEAPTPSYENDPNDPTKGGETPVPDIPGYTPQQPTVDPEDPGKDTPVTYVPVPKDQTAKIVYVDAKTGETIQTDTTTGKSGERIDYTTADKIQDFINKGYVLVEDGFKAAGDPTYDDDESQDQTFIIKLNHAVAPVGPNDPHEPGTPINPDDPNSPLWPNLDQYNKQYTSTVHFVDENGNKLRDDVVQTSTWTRNLLIDKVTGEILNPDEPWTPDKENYAEVNVPVINGYYADKAVVPGDPTQQKDLETSVTYKKIGVIVPVDENGVPIPGAPTPQYKNDPNDPTKVIVTTTPDVPGYSATIGSVDPIDPGANTPVIYKKDTTSTPEPQNSTPTTPTAKTVATEPQATTPVTQTQTTTQKQAVKATTATELPQTGDEEDTTQTLLGVTLLAGLAGLVGFGKKRKTKS
ncbi:mlp [Ligilactobacillus apodemi DSM 16634 = JCM 16172]|uniref:Mlp n=1 Tax=Ligilactobacillus apodemi DSM 16634 = JCM 16172 TaxID=1423724 RepID=A0A0R1TXH4_9LACO|nr:mlp [Ligilactobacillus apodemi DSM 16634 = JCM 16172]